MQVCGGGAVYCDQGSPRIRNSLISGNTAQYGGGLGCFSAGPELINCIIADNEVIAGGGGIDCVVSNNVDLTNCTLAGNLAGGSGGAIRCEESVVTVTNSILWANDAGSGPQVALIVFIPNPCTISIDYSDVQGGEGAVHTDPCSIVNWGSGNIVTDPCFALFDPNGDPNMWDFHLFEEPPSPCIDAGDPNSEWSPEPWPNGKRINMGAYGGTQEASKNGNLADFNVDGVVDLVDFAQFSSQWKIGGQRIEDLSNNGLVDLADSSIFADNWLWQE